MHTTRLLNYNIHETVLVVTASLNIEWVAAFPVDIIREIQQCGCLISKCVPSIAPKLWRIQNAQNFVTFSVTAIFS